MQMQNATLGLSFRGRWLAGFLLAAGSSLIPLTLQPLDNPPEPPRSIVLGRHSKPIHSLAFAPDGKTLASGGGWPHVPGEIKLWDLGMMSERLAFADPHGVVYSLAFAPNARTVVTTGMGTRARCWDTATGAERGSMESLVPNDVSVHVAFSPDGQRLALSGWHRDVALLELATGAEVVIGRGSGPVAFDPSGRLLAAACWDTTPRRRFSPIIRVWEVTTGREVVTLTGHSFSICGLCFSPDGRVLASASYDGTIRIWDMMTGESQCVLRGHEGPVNGVAFSPDGRTVASGGQDRTVKLWDTLTGQELSSLWGHAGAVTAVVFAPDGRHIASGSYDGTVRLWPVGTDR
jgi:WD40 repeat protein